MASALNAGSGMAGRPRRSASIELRRCSSARLRCREHPLQTRPRLQFAAIASTALRQRCSGAQLIAEAAVLAACGPRHRTGRRSCARSVCQEQRAFGRESHWPSHDPPASRTYGRGGGESAGEGLSGFGGSGDLSTLPAATAKENHAKRPHLITVKNNPLASVQPMKSSRFASTWDSPVAISALPRGGYRLCRARGQQGSLSSPPSARMQPCTKV